MKKSAASLLSVDVPTFEKALAAGRVLGVRLWGAAEAPALDQARFRTLGPEEYRPHELELEGLDLGAYQRDLSVRWAFDWTVGAVGRAHFGSAGLFCDAIQFLPREVSEPAWAVGQLYLRGYIPRCSFALLPASWERTEQGGFRFVTAQLLGVAAVPWFVKPLASAEREGIPLGWLKEWVEKTLAEAATSEEARLRLVCPPDLLAALHEQLAPPAVQVPADTGDDVLVERVDALVSAVDRLVEVVKANSTEVRELTAAVRHNSAEVRVLAQKATHFMASTEARTATPAPANGATTESRG